MFGNRQRRDAEALAAIREELSTADRHARAMLNDVMGQIDQRLNKERTQHEELQASTELAFRTMQSAVAASSNEVAIALGQVANICAIVVERLEDDRIERRALTEAISRLAQAQLQPPAPPKPLESPDRMIGGTVFATPAISEHGAPNEISLVDEEQREADDRPYRSPFSREQYSHE